MNIFEEDDLKQDEFQKMFEASLKQKKDDFTVGDKVYGIIASIRTEDSFVDISGKSEAIIETSELKDSDGNLKYKVGDKIEAYIASITRGEITLTKKIGKNAPIGILETAYQNEIPVEGTIVEATKGGYRVSLGGLVVFCPFSQIDNKAGSESDYINQTFQFKIIEFKEEGQNIIVSRRALLEQQKKALESEMKLALVEGAKVLGKVSSIKDFGVFVDVNGIDAFIPRSELGWSKTVQPNDFTIGEKVNAIVLSADWENKKISLSIKKYGDNPWNNLADLTIGPHYSGKVLNIIKSGAFIEIKPGIEGFVHISKLSKTKNITSVNQVLKLGDDVMVSITSIDLENKKISLDLVTDEKDPWLDISEEMIGKKFSGIIENIKPTGVLLRLENGLLGFLPKSELSDKPNIDIQKNFPVGSSLEVTLESIDKEKRNAAFSMLSSDAEDYKNYMEKTDNISGTSLGSLLKEKFESLKQLEKE
jgi:small subunit ribosomal protein S1